MSLLLSQSFVQQICPWICMTSSCLQRRWQILEGPGQMGSSGRQRRQLDFAAGRARDETSANG